MDLNRLLKHGWIPVVIWVLIFTAVILTMPDMGLLVREKGQVVVGSTYPSSIGDDILKKINNPGSKNAKEISVALIYYNPNKLNDKDRLQIKVRMDLLEQMKEKYHIVSMDNLFTNEDLADSLTSKDGTTILVPLTIDKANRSVSNIRDEITNVSKVDGVQLYTTSADLVTEDFILTTEKGVEQTEIITIVFIILVLLIIFRSPITPFVTIISVGLSFFTALNVVLQLVKFGNFPISSFTKVFLILVLFGIGTDYTMLLLMRYKEELYKGIEKKEAVLTAYKTAGKTVFLSSLTILIGFTCLYFAQFCTYRSAAAVAIGVAILLVVLFTFVPGMMILLGKNLFWSPFHTEGHSDSKAWRWVSAFSVKYPGITLLFTVLICGLIFFYNDNLSYNNMKEVGKQYSSITGNNIVTAHFSKGQVMPVTIAIDSKSGLDNQIDLSSLDSLTEAVKRVDGVEKVYCVTQPKGDRLKELYLHDQADTLDNGLNDAKDGLTQIQNGLQDAIQQMNASTDSMESIQQLQDGANDLIYGLDKLTEAGIEFRDKLKDGSGSAEELSNGIQKVDKSIGSVENGLTQLYNGYTQISNGLGTIDTNLQGIMTGLSGIKTGLEGIVTMQGQLAANPAYAGTLMVDPVFQTMVGTTNAMNNQFGTLQAGVSQLEAGVAHAKSSLDTANAGLAQAQAGLSQIKSGTSQLAEGGLEMNDSISGAAPAQSQIVVGMATLDSVAKKLREGQNQLIDGLSKLSSQVKELKNGLNDAKNGVTTINDGLGSANDYLTKLSTSKVSTGTFYIPADKIHESDFTRSMNTYMSKDRKTTKILITLNVDPYTRDGMKVVDNISKVVSAFGPNSTLKDSSWGITGITQTNNDLKAMSSSDFTFARVIMLIGIFIVLIFITRDIWMPIFVMISLLASYFLAISLSSLFFQHVARIGDLSWNVPFCSFIMIVTLGVDYSIFLIMRHKENENMKETDSITQAAFKVGSVIISAGLILSGTFASMYPSGVDTLMEIAVTVIVGIAMLCLVFLPVFIPTMVSLKTKLIGIKD